MQGLRPDPLDLCEEHRRRAVDVLVPAASEYQGEARLRDFAGGRALLGQEPGMLVSVTVSAAAAAVERRLAQQRSIDESGLIRLGASDFFPALVLSELRRRRLPFAPADVELLLDLATYSLRRPLLFARSYETVACAVDAAADLLREAPGSPPVLAALERLVASIDALGLAPKGLPNRLRAKAKALIAANVPGGILDLSVIDGRDQWAPLAADVLRRHAERWDGVHQLLSLMASARSSRPSQAWRRRAAALAAAHDELAELLRGLLEPVLAIDVVDSGVAWPPVWLLAPDNETLLRGAIWALAEVDEPWVARMLGRLALRGAAASPHPKATTALARTVAGAAVEALAMIGTPAALGELRTLLAEVRRRDMLKRVAAILGEPPERTEERDRRIRIEKRREVRRRMG